MSNDFPFRRIPATEMRDSRRGKCAASAMREYKRGIGRVGRGGVDVEYEAGFQGGTGDGERCV